MRELIIRLNNLMEALKDAQTKVNELNDAKARIAELEAQLVAKDGEIATAKAEIERINKENEETRIAELAQLDEAVARLEAIVNK